MRWKVKKHFTINDFGTPNMWYALLSYSQQNSVVAPNGVKKKEKNSDSSYEHQQNKFKIACYPCYDALFFHFPKIVKYVYVVHFLQTDKYDLCLNLHSVAWKHCSWKYTDPLLTFLCWQSIFLFGVGFFEFWSVELGYFW